MHYTPPPPEALEALKIELRKSSGEMAELFGLAGARQWRRYTSQANDPQNRRDMGAHMLFFAMARLELDAATVERVLARMRKVGAQIDLDADGESQP